MAAHAVGIIGLYPPARVVDTRNIGGVMAVVARIDRFYAGSGVTGCAGNDTLAAVIERKRVYKGATLPRLGGMASSTITAVGAQMHVIDSMAAGAGCGRSLEIVEPAYADVARCARGLGVATGQLEIELVMVKDIRCEPIYAIVASCAALTKVGDVLCHKWGVPLTVAGQASGCIELLNALGVAVGAGERAAVGLCLVPRQAEAIAIVVVASPTGLGRFGRRRSYRCGRRASGRSGSLNIRARARAGRGVGDTRQEEQCRECRKQDKRGEHDMRFHCKLPFDVMMRGVRVRPYATTGGCLWNVHV